MAYHAINAGDGLWDELAEHGCRCYLHGTAFLSQRSFSNLAEVLGIGTSRALSRMMRLSGIPEAYITGGASDYDKLEALCRVLPLWVGHPYVMAIRETLRRVFGIIEPLSVESLPTLWRQTAAHLFETDLTPAHLLRLWGVGRVVPILANGETEAPVQEILGGAEPYLYLPDLVEGLWRGADAPRLSPKTPAEDMAARIERLVEAHAQRGYGGVWVEMSALDIFRRPDPYRPAQGVLRLQAEKDSVGAEDRRLMMTQTLRLLGNACVKRGLRLTLTNAPDGVHEPLCRYLEGCGCLPQTEVVLSTPCDALLWGVTPLLAVPDRASEAGLDRRIADFAAAMPLGRLGGLYRSVREPLELPLWVEAGRTLCRYVAAMGARGWGSEARGDQIELLKRLLG